MQTERVTFLTTADHKAALDAFATSNGMSVGHVVREATSRYLLDEDMGEEEHLGLLASELCAVLPRIHATLDRTIAKLDAAHEEIARMREEAGFPK